MGRGVAGVEGRKTEGGGGGVESDFRGRLSRVHAFVPEDGEESCESESDPVTNQFPLGGTLTQAGGHFSYCR